MDFSGSHTFASSNPQQVWDALHNADTLKKCVPGIEQLSWEGTNAINVQASVGMGPMSRTFYGTVPVTESTAPNHMKVEVHRTIVDGFVNIEIAPQGSGSVLSYNSTINVSGPAAPIANMMSGQVNSQLEKFFRNLEANM